MTTSFGKDLRFSLLCAVTVAADAAAFIITKALAGRYGDPGLPPSNRIVATAMAAMFIAATGLTLVVARASGRRTAAGDGAGLRIVAAASVVLFTFALLFPPTGSADNRWNLLMARAWPLHGANPYVTTPDDLRGDPVYPSVAPAWRGWTAVYGPLWTMLSSLAASVSADQAVEDLALRLLCVAGYLAAGLLLHSALAKRRGDDASAVLAFWLLNPAAAFEIANAGHNEGVLLLFLAAFAVGAALALPRLAAAGLVGAALVKIWPVLFLPSLFGLRAKTREWTLIAVACGAAVVLAYAPFWTGLATFASLIRHDILVGDPYFYAPARFAVYAAASWAGLPRSVADGIAHDLTLGLLLLAIIIAGRLAYRGRVTPVAAAALLFVAYHGVYLNWLQPWHLLAALPLIVGSSLDGHLATDLMALASTLGFAFYGAPPWLVVGVVGATAYAKERARPLS